MSEQIKEIFEDQDQDCGYSGIEKEHRSQDGLLCGPPQEQKDKQHAKEDGQCVGEPHYDHLEFVELRAFEGLISFKQSG